MKPIGTKKCSMIGMLVSLSLLNSGTSDKMIAACGVVLALGSTSFAVSMINRNLNQPASKTKQTDYSYDVLAWKQPIMPAIAPHIAAVTAAAEQTNMLDVTPLGPVSSKREPDDTGSVQGYSLVIAGKGSAILEGRRGFTEVRIGSHLDANHEVIAIEQRGAAWVVVTTHGTIRSLAP